MSGLYKRRFVVNTFGGLFYLFCLLQWLWVALPYLPQFIKLVSTMQPTPQPVTVAPAVASQPPSLFIILLACSVVVIILAITAYVLVKMPVAIGRTGQKVTKSASHYIVPVVSRHKKLTPKARLALTSRVIIDVKIAMCSIPVAATALGFAVDFSIDYDIAMLIAALLALVSLTLLSTQVGLAKLLKVPLDKIW